MDATADTVVPDPGLELKMDRPGFAGLRAVLAGGEIDAATAADINERCDFIDARYDCADFRVLVLLKLLFAAPDRLDQDLRERITATLLGFKYWMDEPGVDGMCQWSENHQVIAAVTEYLAGQYWPQERFTNSGLSGSEHRAKATTRLQQWLQHRFRFGYSEWLSPTYYEEHAAALVLFIDHAADQDLVQRARMALDLLLADLALHSWAGPDGPRFLASSGRTYHEVKLDPATARIGDILAEVHGTATPTDPVRHPESLSVIFRARQRYQIPPVLRAIAQAPGERTVRATFGLDADEVVPAVGPGVGRAGLFFWAMEAFTLPESIELTAEMMHRFNLHNNTFLAAMTPFVELRGRGVLPRLTRMINPATSGVAIQRANVVTTRSESWLVSAAQLHHPMTFADQQHSWQILLPGDVSVFSTHPAAPFFDDAARNFSPGYWVGHGRMPRVAADQNLIMVLHDLGGRSGYLEGPRYPWTHLHWPAARFDEARRGERWVAGRVGDSYVGVLARHPIEEHNGIELRQHGRVTAWTAICSDAAESGSFEDFVDGLLHSAMRVRTETPTRAAAADSGDRSPGASGRGRSRVLDLELDPLWAPARERWQFALGPEFMIDKEVVDVDHPRLDSPYGRVDRDPSMIEFTHGGLGLKFDWDTGERELS